MEKPIVLIAGDVCADWLLFEKQGPNTKDQRQLPGTRAWKQEKQVFIPAVHGGAWIVERFLRMLISPEHSRQVYTYSRFAHDELRSGDSRHIVHQLTQLKYYPLQQNNPRAGEVYRAIPGSYRFFGPDDDSLQIHPGIFPAGPHDVFPADSNEKKEEQIERLMSDLGSSTEEERLASDVGYVEHLKKSQSRSCFFPTASERRIVVLYDRGNGFADHKQTFLDTRHGAKPRVIKDSRYAWEYMFLTRDDAFGSRGGSSFLEAYDSIEHIILSIKELPVSKHPGDSPSWTHPILEYLRKNNLLLKTTVVLDANDLRSKGAHITRGASWERTVEDTSNLFNTNSFLSSLKNAHKIVIRFGISGAIVRIHGGGLEQTSLIFDPTCNETGYYDRENHGVMYPMDAVVVASLASQVFSRLNSKEAFPTNVVDDCLKLVSFALANCRTYAVRGINPSVLSRESLENWDRDFCKKVHEKAYHSNNNLGNEDLRATTLGVYVNEDKKKKVVRIKWIISINDDGDFGGYFTDPGLATHVCKLVAEETLKGRVAPLLDGMVSRHKRGHSRFIPELRAFEGRSSRIFASLDVDFSDLNTVEKSNVFKTLYDYAQNEVKGFPRKAEFDSISNDQKIVLCIKHIFLHFHDIVSLEFGHRMLSPFSVFDYSDNCFSSVVLSPSMEDMWALLPTGEEKLVKIAENIVQHGFERTRDDEIGVIPYARFGEMTIIDRQEIETFRSLNLLVRNYLARQDPERPLCAAVFGPPGSGKSFGVKQLAQSCGIKKEDMLEFNLSQFESRMELERALINVRNACSPNRTPLVFFDEFDSTLGSQSLGWLKMFLSVMQDGTFSFNGDLMRLGKSILIFAGGTSHTFNQFACADVAKESPQHGYFRSVKGPDFVSRLRGYIDIAGINPNKGQHGEGFHFLRRAAMIRSIIVREYPGLVDQEGFARIDAGVLRALIRVPQYTHGARSLAALFDMSNLVGRRIFEKSYLPSAQQLAMHLESTDSPKGVSDFLSLLDTPTDVSFS